MFKNPCDPSNDILVRIMADPPLKAENVAAVAVAASTDQAYRLLSSRSICPDIGGKKMAQEIDFQCPTIMANG